MREASAGVAVRFSLEHAESTRRRARVERVRLKKRKHFPSEHSFAICLISLAFPRRDEGDVRKKTVSSPYV